MLTTATTAATNKYCKLQCNTNICSKIKYKIKGTINYDHLKNFKENIKDGINYYHQGSVLDFRVNRLLPPAIWGLLVYPLKKKNLEIPLCNL